jgi:ubiquinone biosynthesis protein
LTDAIFSEWAQLAMKLPLLTRFDRNAHRLREIVTILAKYGLADWMAALKLKFLKNWLRSADGQKLGGLTTEARIRLAITELGTTFIKLGQMLSTRGDLIGPAQAEELAHLQDNTPPDAPEIVRATIEAELGKPPEVLFAEFEAQAFASASIGQVHRARLADGRPVVVKVQHTRIEEKVTIDLELLMGLAELAQNHVAHLRPYQPAALAREFRRLLQRELDFRHERRNLEQFAVRFARVKTVQFPEVFPELCSRRVLTMGYLDGIKGTNRQGLQGSGVDLTEFARRAGKMYLDMIFRDGFYHADPHPGNYVLLPGGVVGVLDCGMVGRIDEQLREQIERMLLAVIAKDGEELAELVTQLGSVPPGLDVESLRSELVDFVNEYSGVSLQEFDLSGALTEMIEIIRRFHILLPSNCALLLKTLIMLEGVSRQLNPDFSLAELSQPYYVKALRRRYSPRRVFDKLRHGYREWERLLNSLPRDLAEILDHTRKGTFQVRLDLKNLENSVHRLMFGLFAAILFLGATALLTRTPPHLPPELTHSIGFVSLGASVWLGYRSIRGAGKGEDQKKR